MNPTNGLPAYLNIVIGHSKIHSGQWNKEGISTKEATGECRLDCFGSLASQRKGGAVERGSGG